MRKTLNLIIASLLFMMLSIPANAGHGFDDIIILQDKESEGEVIHRNPTLIPIECFLVSDSIQVFFLENLGLITVEIENLTTGEYTQTVVNSATGSAIFPISGNTGSWTITFSLSDGTEYYGEFVIS